MSIFDVLTLIGGLCLFLFGMNVMGQALERRAGPGLRNMLERISDHCSNIAGCIMDLQDRNMNIHENQRYQKKYDAGFKEMFSEYQEKYAL